MVAWAGLLARRITLGGRGLAFGQSPDHLSGNSKNQKNQKKNRLCIPCKNRKQDVSSSRSHRLILWVPPQAELQLTFCLRFLQGGSKTILSRKELSCKLRFSVETPRPMCTKGGLGFGLVKN